MSLKLYPILGYALLGCLLLTTTQCAPGKPTAAAPHAAAAGPDLYRPALEKARGAAREDGLAEAFRVESKVSLAGGQLRNLNQLRAATNGDLYVVDYERKQAETYDGAGRPGVALGGRGNQPGAHVWPADVAEAAGESIAVADFQSHRVNLFSRGGQFLSSFIYTPQNFSAQRILFDEAAGCFYLFGNRWRRDARDQIVGADLVHKYSAEGEFVASYLPFPDWAKPLDLYNYDYPAVDSDRGSLYVALPFDYTVYRLAPDGQLSVFLKAQEPAFRAPKEGVEMENVAPADSHRHVQNWRLGWTPINAIAVAGDQLVVQYQSFDPLRYTVDVWSLATKKKLKSLKTNSALLTRGRDGYLYFLENVEAKGQDRYDIIRAKLKTL